MVDPSVIERIDAAALKLNLSRSDLVRRFLSEGLDRNPVSEEDLARVRLTSGPALKSNGAEAPDNVVPIAEAPVLTRHTIVEESDGAGGIRTPSSFAGDTPPAALADALLPPDPLPLAA